VLSLEKQVCARIGIRLRARLGFLLEFRIRWVVGLGVTDENAMVMQVVGWMWSATGERTTSNLDPDFAVVLSVPASIKISKSPGLYRIGRCRWPQ